MTSVLSVDIKLSDASVKAIEKCEEFAKSEQRAELDKKRRAIMSRVSDYKTGKLQTIPFKENLSSLREKLVSQI